MKKIHVMIVLSLASLFMCSACADGPTKSASLAAEASKPQQITDIRWDELTAARQAAQVSNNSLIMMR